MQEKLNKKLWNKLVANNPKIRLTLLDLSSINYHLIQKLQVDLSLSSTLFAFVLGVKKRTFIKWQQGKKTISNSAKIILYLIDNDPTLIKKIISIKDL